jgi:hypothetical protein
MQGDEKEVEKLTNRINNEKKNGLSLLEYLLEEKK